MVRRLIYTSGQYRANQEINALIMDIDRALKGVKVDVEKAALQAGKIILDNTLPLTPMDTGALRESGRVEVETTEKGTRAKVIFGNEEVGYATIVHEDMQPKNWTTPGTGPKYLALGAAASMDEIKRLFADIIKKAVARRRR